MTENVLPLNEALAAVFTHAQSLVANRSAEAISLSHAAERVLAAPVIADRDQPPFDRSTRDGYALHSADLAAGRTLSIAGSVRAGEFWRNPPLASGQAVEIMTGAPVPAGADAVLMLEHATVSGSELRAEARALRLGENIVPRAAEAHAGDTLLHAGRILQAAEIGVAASCGCASVEVYARPRVAIVATGDELVDLEKQPQPWQIRNSNSYMLAALVHAEGGSAVRLPIAPDTLDDLEQRLALVRQPGNRAADLLLLSGGVSMGKFDLVEQALAEAGAEFVFTGALIQPGKPVVFGRLPRSAGSSTWTYFFGLPGNPVSTQVCFHLFVAPMLRALSGRTDIEPRFVEARLAADIKGGVRVTRFLPAHLASAWDGVTVRVVGWQGSGDLAANARGNCYLVLPAGVDAFHAGETVRVLLR